VSNGRRVLRNSLLRGAGFVLGSGLQFLTIVVVARYLGVAGFGRFSLVMAIGGLFQIVVDMGVRNVVVRDLAVDRERLAERVGVARTLVLLLSGASLAVVAVLALAVFEGELRQALLIGGVAMLVTMYSLVYGSVLRAFEEMDLDIAGFVLHKLVLVALVGVVAGTAWGLRGVFLAMLVANLCQLLYYQLLVRVRHGRTRLSGDLRAAWRLLEASFLLGVAELLRRSTWYADRLLLAALATPAALGLFTTAYKFVEAMRPLAMNLTLPLFPALSRMAVESRERLACAFERSLKFLAVAGLPPALLLAVYAERLVTLLFSQEFAGAAPALRLLAPVLLLQLPAALFTYVFTALGWQRAWGISAGLCLSVNLVMNLVLIPRFAASGAAVALLLSELTLLGTGLAFLKSLTGRLPALAPLGRPLAAAAAMAVPCWLAREAALPLAAGGALGGSLLYIAVLLGLGTFSRGELSAMRDAVRPRAA